MLQRVALQSAASIRAKKTFGKDQKSEIEAMHLIQF